MAPPGKRRPGFSRRAQYGVFIGYVIAVAGCLVAVLLLAIAIIDPKGFQALRTAAADVTAPISSAGRSVVGFFSGIGDTLSNYWNAGAQNADLHRQLEEAQRELNSRRALEYENQRLLALLGLARQTDDEVTTARITSSSFQSPRRLATLAAGSGSGVTVGMPVRNADGLIGRVLESGRWASRVLLVTDAASNVPVRLVRDGTPALAVGRGDGTIELRTLEVGQIPFRRGDILVTSGAGGLFPPNIPVATVIGREGERAIARPIADPGRLDFAIVQRIHQPAADGALDAARPVAPAAPVPAPPQPAPATRPGQQNDPRYQPALQQQSPALNAAAGR
ncbi:MAG TPA: rod shape-determining protein MreC [Allosphingosinicella sp.]|nr:rod shape-determining protein MreC [Allosphingosinicella sp.]